VEKYELRTCDFEVNRDMKINIYLRKKRRIKLGRSLRDKGTGTKKVNI
jgi:hypothetical protein